MSSVTDSSGYSRSSSWPLTTLKETMLRFRNGSQRALLEMRAVGPADLPYDLREQFAPIRHARRGVSLAVTTVETEAAGQAILRLRVEVNRRIDPR